MKEITSAFKATHVHRHMGKLFSPRSSGLRGLVLRLWDLTSEALYQPKNETDKLAVVTGVGHQFADLLGGVIQTSLSIHVAQNDLLQDRVQDV